MKLRSVFSLRCHRQGWSEDVLKVRLAQLLSWKIVSIRLQKQIKKIKSQKNCFGSRLTKSKHGETQPSWLGCTGISLPSQLLFVSICSQTNKQCKKKKKKDFCSQSIVLREKKYSTVLLSHSSGFYLLGVNGYESKHPDWFLLERCPVLEGCPVLAPGARWCTQEPGQDTPVTRWTGTILKRKIRLRMSAVCAGRGFILHFCRDQVSVYYVRICIYTTYSL